MIASAMRISHLEKTITRGGNEHVVGERIIQLVRSGIPPLLAARECGVSDRSFYRWRRNAESGEEPYAEWAARLSEAEGQSVSELIIRHRQLAMGGQLRSRTVKKETRLSDEGVEVTEEVVKEEFFQPNALAMQWALERRFPEFFGQVIARDARAIEEEAGDAYHSELSGEDQAREVMGQLDRIAAHEKAGAASS